MAYLDIRNPPVFTEKVHRIEEEEYLTAELENEIKGALLNNEIFLKVLAETIQKTVEEHIGNGNLHVTAQDKSIWSNKAATNHLHDERYYTKTESNNLLNRKSNTNHSHDERYYTEAEVNNLLNGKAAASHIHDERYYTEAEVNGLLNGKAATSHSHDERYYTEAEVNGLLNGKAASNHTHVGLVGWSDTRNTPTTPNDYNGTLKCVGIKTATGLGSSLDGSGFATVFGCRGWHDATGGYSHEFAFTGNGNVYHRSGSTTTWNKPWKRILTYQGNLTYANKVYAGPTSGDPGEATFRSLDLKDLPSNYESGYVRSGVKAGTTAGSRATIEGYNNIGSGPWSHVEGHSCAATQQFAHAEGGDCIASASAAHCEGRYNEANGANSHCSGSYNIVNGNNAAVYGYHNKSNQNVQFVCGMYNELNDDSYFVVGCGNSESNRLNGFMVKSSGRTETRNLYPQKNIGWDCGGPSNRWATIYGRTGNFSGNVITAAANDYAEYYERGIETEPGDIIMLDLSSDEEKYICATEGSMYVVGVHSDSYGFVVGGNPPSEEFMERYREHPEVNVFQEYNDPNFIPVGLNGRVKTKIIGRIQKGDAVVVSSIPGVGRRFEKGKDDRFFIIGFVTETNLEEGIKRVKMQLKI